MTHTIIDYRLGGLIWRIVSGQRQLVRLPDEVQKCVVFFGLKMPDKKTGLERIKYGGTGFFVGFPSQVPGATFIVLVTAAHIAQKLEHGEFFIRANKKDGSAIEYRVDGGTEVSWHFHPTDDSIDAAIAIWGPPHEDGVDYLCVPHNMFLDPDRILEKGLGTDDEIYITGLFRLLYGTRRNLPIVRSGNLAMLPTDRVPIKDWKTPDVEAYLVESRSIGGASGSPVFVQRSIKVQPAEHTGRPPIAAGAVFWLGLVMGAWDERRISAADDWGVGMSIEVGLSVMVPCHRILEIFNGEDIQRQMDERQHVILTEFYEELMDGSSPSEVPHHKAQLAAAVMSAPALNECPSDGHPDFAEIIKTGGANQTHSFDDVSDESTPPANDENPTHQEDFKTRQRESVNKKIEH
jgi:hypothetical protein